MEEKRRGMTFYYDPKNKKLNIAYPEMGIHIAKSAKDRALRLPSLTDVTERKAAKNLSLFKIARRVKSWLSF